jgi:hypothetical protein
MVRRVFTTGRPLRLLVVGTDLSYHLHPRALSGLGAFFFNPSAAIKSPLPLVADLSQSHMFLGAEAARSQRTPVGAVPARVERVEIGPNQGQDAKDRVLSIFQFSIVARGLSLAAVDEEGNSKWILRNTPSAPVGLSRRRRLWPSASTIKD